MNIAIFTNFSFSSISQVFELSVCFLYRKCSRKRNGILRFLLRICCWVASWKFCDLIDTNFYLYSALFSEISPVQHEDEGGQLSEIDQPPIIQLLASIWFGILAHSCLLCYFMVFLHQIKNASVLSTPLPLMVFCWGSLTIPRPSKTFWITLIAYTEVKHHCSNWLVIFPRKKNFFTNQW